MKRESAPRPKPSGLAATPDHTPFSDRKLAALFQPVENDPHVALAVSGGSDSLALMCLAAQWGVARVTVLTVDHRMRPESGAEATFVSRFAGEAGLAHHTLPWTGPKPTAGIQAAARRARYDLLSSYCVANAIPTLLTGHNLDDQAETVLMRLARTSSLNSIAGIPVTGHWGPTRLFRPLLSVRRATLRSYLHTIGQSWIDDPSNGDVRFERVRIRNLMRELIPAGISPEGLARLAQEAAAAVKGLWAAAEDWITAHVIWHETAHCFVPLGPFRGQSIAVRTRILGLLVARQGSGKMPEPSELELLSAWLEEPGSRRTLGGAIIARRKALLLIGREPGRIDQKPVVIPLSGRANWDRRFEIEAPPGCEIVAAGTLAHLPRWPGLPAFVQASLPAVMFSGHIQSVPHLGIGSGASVRLLAGPTA